MGVGQEAHEEVWPVRGSREEAHFVRQGNQEIDDRMDKKSVLCRYYMNGACRFGAACEFSHIMRDLPSLT